MIGVLVIGHVGVGAELLRAAEHVLGPQAAGCKHHIGVRDEIHQGLRRFLALREGACFIAIPPADIFAPVKLWPGPAI